MASRKKMLSVIVLSVMALNIYIATVADVPSWLIAVFGGIAIIAQIIKDQIVDEKIAAAASIAPSS